MKIAVVTMKVKSGKCKENVAFMKSKIEAACKEKVDLIVFPELAISGSLLGDRWKEKEWCEYVESFHQEIFAYSNQIAIVFGSIKYRNHHVYNSAYFCYKDEIHMCVKQKSTSALMDFSNFSVHPIQSHIIFQNKTISLGFEAKKHDTDLAIVLAANPFDIHQEHIYYPNTIYVNCVGMQNENKAVLMMEGGSYVAWEHLCYQSTYGEEDFAIVTCNDSSIIAPKTVDLWNLLVACIKDFDQQVMHAAIPWIIGLSGGIDSCVSAALLKEALGSDRVIGYGLSTSCNSSNTKQNARHIANALQIQYHEGEITPLVEASKQVVMKYQQQECDNQVMENVQARIRGHLLSTFAAMHGGVVVNNGNKVEVALGYCTLYGDAIGALSVIGDLTKVQLFELAKQYNQRQGKEIIPQNLFPKSMQEFTWEVMPSAELSSGQKDPMKWFYHDYLIEHLGYDLTLQEWIEKYENNNLQHGELQVIMNWYHLFDKEEFYKDLKWFVQTANKNAFKHLQCPPIITISSNGYALRKEIQGSCDAFILNREGGYV